MALRALGRQTPSDFSHVLDNPLRAGSLASPKPVSLGINWYTSFDAPKLIDGSHHLPDVSKGESLGTVRGGHCVCLAPMGFANTAERISFLEVLWVFYNQLAEGACEGFGHSKATSLELHLLKGVSIKYDAFQLYDNARRVEGTFPSGEGTTNRATVEALLKYGVSRQVGAECQREIGDTGYVKPVTSYAWTKDTQEVLTALGRLNALAVPLLNLWGKDDYPLITWLPVPTLARLLAEEGEADCCTDA